MSYHNLVQKPVPVHQAMKTPDAKAADDKEWAKHIGRNQKLRANERSSKRHRKKAKQFILQRSWTHVTWKNAKLDKKIQKYKGRVVTRGDVVQNDLDSYAVFTGQESSASHMTAAKVLDVISGLPGCAGLASDVLSAYTHMKIEGTPELLRLPESDCPAIWTCRPRPRRPNSWDKIQDPVVTRKRNFYEHFFTKIAMWTTIRKGLDRKWFGKRVQTGNVYSCTAERFVSVRGCARHLKKGREQKRIKTNGTHNVNTSVRPSIIGTYAAAMQVQLLQENNNLLESLISVGTIKQ